MEHTSEYLIHRLPSNYTVVRELGRGNFCTVYLCKVTSPSSSSPESIAGDHDENIKSHPVESFAAVKIVREHQEEVKKWTARETEVLKIIQEESEEKFKKIFPQILSFDPDHLWLAMTAFTTSKTLAAMELFCMENQRTIPEGLLLHIFSEQKAAVDFLHQQCNVSHGDLQLGNVLLDYSERSSSAFPQIFLIDFALSKQLSDQKGIEQGHDVLDRSRVCLHIRTLFNRGRICSVLEPQDSHATCSHSEAWKLFMEFLRKVGISSPLKEAWEKLGICAEVGKSSISEVAMHEVSSFVADFAASP
ncbi:kinase-like protein [Corynespora cassiicola Philippines]|uniref:Kinase-like protein n=1 Tax=Corynespora cassiicola Philippines TaxID=1448308 RepID=A0A2T2NJY2_CORCC|nr:kinase-like protein [Corynespora cassiicola Philippines]